MKNDIVFDYSYLIDKIVKFYNLNEAQSISKLSKDAKINPYRMKSILTNRGYFLTKEVYLISNVLKLSSDDIHKSFLTKE